MYNTYSDWIEEISGLKVLAEISLYSELFTALEVEVFDVSHNPELGGIIPEQIIVDWAEARRKKGVFVRVILGDPKPVAPRIQDTWPQGSGLFGHSEHNNCRIYFKSLQWAQ